MDKVTTDWMSPEMRAGLALIAQAGAGGAIGGERSSASPIATDLVGTRALTFVGCAFHGTNLAEPRHIDTHHLDTCPEGPHCAYCFHGYPLNERCPIGCAQVLTSVESEAAL